ncbi:MAG: exonuclease subunit SbcD [Clostridia bacterium]|nr:exonuclease subunit SbcD [Clostridia bacterium]
MKILHTSDWHVGKRLNNRERLSEQEDVLNEIISVCERENVELVLIAGDVFDTYTPSADAERLFFKAVKKLAGTDRAVLMISGNHDDGTRLSASIPVAEECGVYIVGNERLPLAVNSDRKVRPIESGKGYSIFENEGGERVFVSTLPYPNEARFKEEKSDLSYLELIQKWIAECEAGNEKKYPSVFMSHLFVLGGVVSESEREIGLGGARALPVNALPNSDYIALGHLHKKQKMGAGHCYYSGSPLQYSFDEVNTEKVVKVFDLTQNGVENLRDVPLTAGRKLMRLEATSPILGAELLDKYPEALVELTLHLSAPLTATDKQTLSARENLVELRVELASGAPEEYQSRKGLSDENLFKEFYRLQHGDEASAELVELFLSVLAETSEDN